jgi:beta-1,4-mannosyl-glycoprotein beta-1,4-N-acetylglucosaminyltransferase
MLYDCCTYFNEIGILELRLRETEPVVGRWVIVECTHTHQGHFKSSNLCDHRGRLSRWWDRIIHVTVPPRGGTTEERERSQRQDIAAALRRTGIRSDDVVHVSDLDEITRAEVLAA